jgi:hypothetical protein
MMRCQACKFVPPAGVSPTSAEYHRLHRAAHLAAFPSSSKETRDNLDAMVLLAERGRIAAPPAQTTEVS